jgi:hypothetical protein
VSTEALLMAAKNLVELPLMLRDCRKCKKSR